MLNKFIFIGLFFSVFSCSKGFDYQPKGIIDLELIHSDFKVSEYFDYQIFTVYDTIPKDLKNISLNEFSKSTKKFDYYKIDPVFLKDTLFYDEYGTENMNIIPESFIHILSVKKPKPKKIFGTEYQISSILKKDTIAELFRISFPNLIMIENENKDLVLIKATKSVPENDTNKNLIDNLIEKLKVKYGEGIVFKSKFTGHDVYDWENKDLLIRLMPEVNIHGEYTNGTLKSERFINIKYLILNKKYIPEIKSTKNQRISSHEFDFSKY